MSYLFDFVLFCFVVLFLFVFSLSLSLSVFSLTLFVTDIVCRLEPQRTDETIFSLCSFT